MLHIRSAREITEHKGKFPGTHQRGRTLLLSIWEYFLESGLSHLCISWKTDLILLILVPLTSDLRIFVTFFFWLFPRHAEVPGPGIEPMPQQWSEIQQWEHGSLLNWNEPQECHDLRIFSILLCAWEMRNKCLPNQTNKENNTFKYNFWVDIFLEDRRNLTTMGDGSGEVKSFQQHVCAPQWESYSSSWVMGEVLTTLLSHKFR